MNADTAPRLCDHCGLPLPRSWPGAISPSSSTDAAATELQYCCFGCRFAAAVTQGGTADRSAQWVMARLALAIFLSVNVTMFSMVLWTRDVYAIDGSQHTIQLFDELLRYVCMALALPVLLLLAGPIVAETCGAIRAGRLTTDVLLLLGIGASFLYSIVSVLRNQGHIYFEIGCVILIAVTLGRWLEATGKQKTTAALAALQRLLPTHVRVRRATCEVTAPVGEITCGDVLRFLPGERIAVDGVVIQNTASVDEQFITGESQSVEKRPGDRVFAGSLNLDAELFVRATAPVGQGTLQRIVDSVRSAALRKDRYQRLADRIAAWFTPLVVIAAVGGCIYNTHRGTLVDGVLAALAVVLIACPCALGLATPMALWAALAHAARHQVLFRDGDALAHLATIDAIAFDKTGTLTTGKACIAELLLADDADAEDVCGVAASLARASNHPLSAAVAEFALPFTGHTVDSIRSVSGLGVVGHFGGQSSEAALGSIRFMHQLAMRCDAAIEAALDRAEREDLAVVCVGWQGRVRGCFLLTDLRRGEAIQVTEALRRRGIRPIVLTGDRLGRCGDFVAHGIEVRAELLPDEKLFEIESLQNLGGSSGAHEARRRVAMVGDGVNDAPALATADVGIALGCGADVSRASAGVCLLSNDLLRIPWAVDLARRTVRTIRWNLAFAFVYNLVGVALAAAGQLNPIFAAIAMTGSSLLVVSNSLRLGHPLDHDIDLGSSAAIDPENPAASDVGVSETTPIARQAAQPAV